MSLKSLIERIRKNEWKESDYDHPLARCIFEEFVKGSNNKFRKRLFNYIRKFNDEIITDYLRSDEVAKRYMLKIVSNRVPIKTEEDYYKAKDFALTQKQKREQLSKE